LQVCGRQPAGHLARSLPFILELRTRTTIGRMHVRHLTTHTSPGSL
jgi:hypothetical protein